MIELSSAQALFAMPDQSAQDRDSRATAGRRQWHWLGDVSATEAFTGAEVLDWQTLAPEMVTLVRMTDLAGTLVLVLVLPRGGCGRREHDDDGDLRAHARVRYAARPWHASGPSGEARDHQIQWSLGVIGAFVGTAVGVTLVVVTHRTGMTMPGLPVEGRVNSRLPDSNSISSRIQNSGSLTWRERLRRSVSRRSWPRSGRHCAPAACRPRYRALRGT